MDRFTLQLSDGEKPGMDYMRKGTTILIKSVRDGSAAALAGVTSGGVVHFMNDQRIDGVEKLASVLQAVENKLILDIEQRGGSDRVIELTLITPTGTKPAVLSVLKDVLRINYEGNFAETLLESLSHVTLLTVPPLDVTCIHLHNEDQMLFANVSSDHLLETINRQLFERNLPPLDVLDQTEGSRTGSLCSERSIPQSEQPSPVHNATPLLHKIKTIDMMYVCNMEAVAKISLGAHVVGITAEELPDCFAGIKPVLARRGGALVYYVANSKEGIVAVGTQAIYRWVLQGSDTMLARCIPIRAISEMVLANGGLVGLRVPEEHDEMLTLPASGVESWVSSIAEVYTKETGYTLPTRRVGTVLPAQFSAKLWLQPQVGWHTKDPIQLTYQRDLIPQSNDFFSSYMYTAPPVDTRYVAHPQDTQEVLPETIVTPIVRPAQPPAPVASVVTPNVTPSHTPAPKSLIMADSFDRQVNTSNGSMVEPRAAVVTQLKAKQAEVASLRSLVAIKQKETAGEVPFSGYEQSAMATATSRFGSPVNRSEKQYLRSQVEVLSNQLRGMVEELQELKAAPTPAPVPVPMPMPVQPVQAPPVAMPVPSPPPPLARLATQEEPQPPPNLTSRIAVLENLISLQQQQLAIPPSSTAPTSSVMSELVPSSRSSVASTISSASKTGLRPPVR